MTEPERPGLFVTFEGVEGSGKSTQVQLLIARLLALGLTVRATREPGGTPLGEVARALTRKPALSRHFYAELTGEHWRQPEPLAELFLMSAARAQLTGEVILPALLRGEVLLCDRYDDSTLAYQGYGRGLSLDELRAVNAIATRGTVPDLTVLIDLPPGAGLRRKLGERGRDVIGGERTAFHARVRQGYLELAAGEPERWLVVPGAGNVAAVHEAIWTRLLPLVSSRRGLRRSAEPSE